MGRLYNHTLPHAPHAVAFLHNETYPWGRLAQTCTTKANMPTTNNAPCAKVCMSPEMHRYKDASPNAEQPAALCIAWPAVDNNRLVPAGEPHLQQMVRLGLRMKFLWRVI